MYGIVLSRRDIREADQTITILTAEDGKRDYLARGVKKIVSKNASFLEPPSLVSFGVAEGKQDISYLTNVQPIEQFFGVRKDLAHLHLVGYSLDALTTMLRDSSPDSTMYQFVISYLRFLDTQVVVRLLLLDAFLIKLFSALGYHPELSHCVVCEKTYKDIALEYIDSKNEFGQSGVAQEHHKKPGLPGEAKRSPGFYFACGGIICAACSLEKKKIKEQILPCGMQEISTLTILLAASWKEIDEYTLEKEEYIKVHTVVYEFVLYHSERKWEDWGNM